MTAYITLPFSWLLVTLYEFTANYGLALILFSLVIKLIMLPFMMKSKYSMMRQGRLNPRVKELEKKYQGNQQKYQQEVQKLYKEEGINPMSGCLWTMIPFPILILLYTVIRQPLTRLMAMTAEQVELVRDTLSGMGLFEIPEKASAYVEITYADIIHNNFAAVKAALPELADKLRDIDFRFLGMNLGDTPDYLFFTKCDWSDVSSWLPAFGLFMIPLVSAGVAFLQTKVSSASAPAANAQAAQSAKMMTMMSPVISLFIGFGFPAALGLYWVAGGAFQILQDLFLNARYKKILDAEDAERIERDKLKAAELERKRIETEKAKAEGNVGVNPNTSKRKRQAAERSKEEIRLAAEKAAKRKAEGSDDDKPASQVGDRRYARGRAYIADRFVNPGAYTDAQSAETDASQSDAESDPAPLQPLPEFPAAVPEKIEPEEVSAISGFDAPVYTSPEYSLYAQDEPDEDEFDDEDEDYDQGENE